MWVVPVPASSDRQTSITALPAPTKLVVPLIWNPASLAPHTPPGRTELALVTVMRPEVPSLVTFTPADRADTIDETPPLMKLPALS